MLQTCNRCRTRRIKCDSNLPACSNCDRAQALCIFRDEVLREDIPRSYVQSLYGRVDELKLLLSLKDSQASKGTDSFDGIIDGHSFRVPAPKTAQYLYLGPSPSAIAASITAQSLLNLGRKLESPSLNLETHRDNDLIDFARVDKSILSNSVIRNLLAHYDRCIYPIFPVVTCPSAFDEGFSLKALEWHRLFNVLMACGISAAHKSFHEPDWRVIAKVCRLWADDIMTPLIAQNDEEALLSLVLLVVYELVDPDNGMLTALLDTATSLCLRLGWHCIPKISESYQHGRHEMDSRSLPASVKAQIVSTLCVIERSVLPLFQKPLKLSTSFPVGTFEGDDDLRIYLRVFSAIYSKTRSFADCPLTGQLFGFLNTLRSSPFEHDLVQKAWLLFLPICTCHQACPVCSKQEPSQEGETILLNIRKRMIQSATSLIHTTHRQMTNLSCFLLPFIVTTEAFTAGCVVVTAIANEWVPKDELAVSLRECSEVLTRCGPLWKKGCNFHKVWNDFITAIS